MRNRLVRYMPSPYASRLDRLTRHMPPLAVATHVSRPLAGFVAAFYGVEPHVLSDAAAGQFALLGETVDFGDIEKIDWYHRLPRENDHHLWRMKLCQLELVSAALASGTPDHLATVERLLDHFDSASDFAHPAAFQVMWSPYGASHRVLAMLSGLALAAGHDLPDQLSIRLQRFIRRDAAFILDNIEYDLHNNHTERNLAALCFYGIATGGLPPAIVDRLNRSVAAIIRDTVLPDGMQVERSAMYQGLTVMSLRIFAATPFLSVETRELASVRAEAAARAWAFLMHDDGEIALFNDSWMEEVPPAEEVIGRTDDAADLSDCLPDAGYARLRGDGMALWMDAGAIGPAWNPGHGHADFLAVELDVNGRRFLVDPGTSQYSTGPERSFERSAASHNGPRFVGVEPVEYLGCFKVGRMNAARLLPSAQLQPLGVPAIGGALDRPDGSVRRIAAFFKGDGILIADHWSSALDAAVRLLIPADWALETAGPSLLRLSQDGESVYLRVVSGQLEGVSSGRWCRRYMRPEAAHVVDIKPDRAGQRQRCILLVGGSARPSAAFQNSVAALCGEAGWTL